MNGEWKIMLTPTLQAQPWRVCWGVGTSLWMCDDALSRRPSRLFRLGLKSHETQWKLSLPPSPYRTPRNNERFSFLCKTLSTAHKRAECTARRLLSALPTRLGTHGLNYVLTKSQFVPRVICTIVAGIVIK